MLRPPLGHLIPLQKPQTESPYHVEVLTGMTREDWMSLNRVWCSAIRGYIELHWDTLIRVRKYLTSD